MSTFLPSDTCEAMNLYTNNNAVVLPDEYQSGLSTAGYSFRGLKPHLVFSGAVGPGCQASTHI